MPTYTCCGIQFESLMEFRNHDKERHKQDSINYPPHYTYSIYEVIDVIEAWQLDFHLGNTVKYIARAGKKDPSKELEDLEKAKWYLERKITKLKETNHSNDPHKS